MSPEVGSAAGKKGKGWPLLIPATTLPNEGMEWNGSLPRTTSLTDEFVRDTHRLSNLQGKERE